MSFLDDILENDATLATGNVNNDAVVRQLVETAAKEGNVKALRAAIERGQVTEDAPIGLVLDIVEVAGTQLTKMPHTQRAERAAFVDEWIAATTPKDPATLQLRLNLMLDACYTKFFDIHDAVAEQLLKLGANPMGEGSLPVREISGARMHLELVQDTTLGRAMYADSKITGKIIESANSRPGYDVENNGAVPVAALMQRGKTLISMNAASFAIAIAAPKQLDQVLGCLDKHNPRVQRDLGQAIEQVVRLRLHDFGADEVHHGIAKLLAAGAHVPDVTTLTKANVVVADSPSMKYFDAKGVPFDGDKPIDPEAASKLQRITLPVALLHTPNPRVVIGALQNLNASGWSPNEVVSVPMDGTKGGATIAHYAALRGDVTILNALREMGADFKVKDALGRAPVEYAWAGLNRASAEVIDPEGAKRLAEQQTKEAQRVHEVPEQPRVSQAHPATAGAAPEARAPQPAAEQKPAGAVASRFGKRIEASRQAYGDATGKAPAATTTAKVDNTAAVAPTDGAQTTASRSALVRDMDEINLMLSEASSDADYDIYPDAPKPAARSSEPVPAAPSPAAPVDPVTKAGAMFAAFRKRQEESRKNLGKPLGLEAAAADAEQSQTVQSAERAREAVAETNLDKKLDQVKSGAAAPAKSLFGRR